MSAKTSKLEVWFQYKGDRASEIQKTPSSRRPDAEAELLDKMKADLQVLGLYEIVPTTRAVVWGTGQMRCSWLVPANSYAFHQIKWLMRSAWIKTPTSGLPIAWIQFRQDGQLVPAVNLPYASPTPEGQGVNVSSSTQVVATKKRKSPPVSSPASQVLDPRQGEAAKRAKTLDIFTSLSQYPTLDGNYYQSSPITIPPTSVGQPSYNGGTHTWSSGNAPVVLSLDTPMSASPQRGSTQVRSDEREPSATGAKERRVSLDDESIPVSSTQQADVVQLMRALAMERSARIAADNNVSEIAQTLALMTTAIEEGQRSLAEREEAWAVERRGLLQQLEDERAARSTIAEELALFKGISPAVLPSLVDAVMLIAQLTDKANNTSSP